MHSYWTKTFKTLSCDLKSNYHNNGKMHGHISPEYISKNESGHLYLMDHFEDEKESISIVTCHPHILDTKIVTEYEHDWYALLVTGIYLTTNLYFNNPETPLLNPIVLQKKIDFFTSTELHRLSVNDDVKNAITYLNFIYRGQIII